MDPVAFVFVLLLAAVIVFLLVAFGVSTSRVNLLAIGFALVATAMLVEPWRAVFS